MNPSLLDAAAPPRTAGAAWRKYWKILRIALVERLAYRADFFVSTIFRFLPLVTSFLLWDAVFKSSGAENLSGFSRDRMIAYLLLVQISRMFSSMPGLAGGIARDIRDGNLKKYLLQPIDMLAYLLSYRAAHKMAYIATSALPYGLLFLVCRDVFPGWPGALTMLAYAVSLLLAFLIGFFFEAAIGMIGFWFLEVSSLLFIYMLFSFFFSGHMFPIDMLPGVWRTAVELLPLQYLAYFPSAVFLGKISGSALWTGLAIQLGWVLFFLAVSRAAWHFGVKRYSGFGG
jgi:ABC-2 type transport system permease protein